MVGLEIDTDVEAGRLSKYLQSGARLVGVGCSLADCQLKMARVQVRDAMLARERQILFVQAGFETTGGPRSRLGSHTGSMKLVIQKLDVPASVTMTLHKADLQVVEAGRSKADCLIR